VGLRTGYQPTNGVADNSTGARLKNWASCSRELSRVDPRSNPSACSRLRPQPGCRAYGFEPTSRMYSLRVTKR